MKPGVKGTGNEQMGAKPKVLKIKKGGKNKPNKVGKKILNMDEKTHVKKFKKVAKQSVDEVQDEVEVQEIKTPSGVQKKPNKLKLKRLGHDVNQESRARKRSGKKLHKKPVGGSDVQCFSCHCHGHQQRHCPSLQNNGMRLSCFRCSSTEHQIKDCPIAEADAPGMMKCFLCKKAGHRSRECPDNKAGLYPFGGGCWICDSKDHLKTQCPDYNKEKS